MKEIKIAQRYRPFSHSLGTISPIPGSCYSAEVFPALIRIHGLKSPLEIHFDLKGPFQGFTCMQDLEKGVLRIFGENASGYFRYLLQATESGLALTLEKAKEKVCIKYGKDWEELIPRERVVVVRGSFSLPAPAERLSLGLDKAQDMDLMKRRGDLREILPLCHKLAAFLPPLKTEKLAGTAVLLRECEENIKARKRIEVLPSLKKLFSSSFTGLLHPRILDTDHQNIIPEENSDAQMNPFFVLAIFRELIRMLFIQEGKNSLSLLPCLPPEFIFGRFIDVQAGFGSLDMEWSKKILRRVILKPTITADVQLLLQPEIRDFRFRHGRKDKGRTCAAGAVLPLQAGQVYYLDRFQK